VASANARTGAVSGPDGTRFRVLVVDDHEIVNWGFRLLLTREPWVERCVTTTDADQAVAYAQRFAPHVAIVDLFLNEGSGVDVSRRIRDVSPKTKVLLTSGGPRVSAKAIRAAGAAGFVSKAWRPPDLARALRIVGLGLHLTPPDEPELPPAQLSAREREILQLIASGATNAQIGEQLSLSLHTVKQHASSIFRKLEVRNRAEAVQRGERLGYIE
jgi:DNA-binding NarL/FixJ family response regulator